MGQAEPSQNFEYSGKWSDISELEWGEHTKIVNIIDIRGMKYISELQVKKLLCLVQRLESSKK